MRTWKIWAITVPIILVMIACAVLAWLWKNVSTNWAPEQQAAQYVLDHTPMSHIDQYEVFTASGLEDVFEGTDTFGHKWYAFYIPAKHTSYSIAANELVPQSTVEQSLLKDNIHTQTCTIGYVTGEASGTLHANADVVYEIRGSSLGKTTFVYVDATNGHILWRYQLSA
ncbi:hypothetical protein NZD89_14810 [Alicyclobacillus fastidiosus]|uniref:DUF5590 domain-containing protein n=1 Tax=Alicyclobacillus fastidiosus TaxID=392011 RepID=A0ABY6ZBV9_9BACL|nr:hypothetical protein [Alicyclobacillus fastidiosus]WAH39689.1 hypothetical protein NZD89_14810 [Alicyclobacillus fastidiosus]GMA60902.1 hypothetical protein GCM10025859_13420 [Alicyclobacillus fastidiosus]